MASEYVLQIPLERHIINTPRLFPAVVEDIRGRIGTPEPGGETRRALPPPGIGELHYRVNGTAPPSRLLSLAEFGLYPVRLGDEGSDRTLRLLIDIPSASEELVRFLPDVGVCCPVTILVQGISAGGTRLVYDSLASTVSVYQDDDSLTVARGFDTMVLSLLRQVAFRG